MRDEMIIDGEKLALYLKAHNISQREFLDAINTSDPFLLGDELAYEYVDCLSSELFKKHARVGYDSACTLVHLLGADVAEKLVDWEAMGFEDKKEISFDNLLDILQFISIYNARKSYAI